MASLDLPRRSGPRCRTEAVQKDILPAEPGADGDSRVLPPKQNIGSSAALTGCAARRRGCHARQASTPAAAWRPLLPLPDAHEGQAHHTAQRRRPRSIMASGAEAVEVLPSSRDSSGSVLGGLGATPALSLSLLRGLAAPSSLDSPSSETVEFPVAGGGGGGACSHPLVVQASKSSTGALSVVLSGSDHIVEAAPVLSPRSPTSCTRHGQTTADTVHRLITAS